MIQTENYVRPMTAENPKSWEKFTVSGDWKEAITTGDYYYYWPGRCADRIWPTVPAMPIPEKQWPSIPDYWPYRRPTYPTYPIYPTVPSTNPDVEEMTQEAIEKLIEKINKEKEKKEMQKFSDYMNEVNPTKYVITSETTGFFVGGTKFSTGLKDEALVFDTEEDAIMHCVENAPTFTCLIHFYIKTIDKRGNISDYTNESIAYKILKDYESEIRLSILNS